MPDKKAPTASDILTQLSGENPDAILWDGFEDALVGIGGRCGLGPVAIYDRVKCIEILMSQGLRWEDAEEYFCFNVEGAYVGEQTPIIASFFSEGK